MPKRQQPPARRPNRELASLSAKTPTTKGPRRAKVTPRDALLVDTDGLIDRTPVDDGTTERIVQAILNGQQFTVWLSCPRLLAMHGAVRG